jgi:8-oxo-dGTP pyrophosphatase MutT (NUDIX family)
MPAQTIEQLKTLTRSLNVDHELDSFSQEHRLAAVLILVYPDSKGLNIILTRRSDKLSNHAGQISFPGGTVDVNDPDPVHTALREAQEEIALESSAVEVLGILEVILLPSGFAVAPVLAIMDSVPILTANPAEVDEIFSIPLSLIADLDQYNQDFLFRSGQKREFYYLEFQDHYIWGATAKMLRTLGQLLCQEKEV